MYIIYIFFRINLKYNTHFKLLYRYQYLPNYKLKLLQKFKDS